MARKMLLAVPFLLMMSMIFFLSAGVAASPDTMGHNGEGLNAETISLKELAALDKGSILDFNYHQLLYVNSEDGGQLVLKRRDSDKATVIDSWAEWGRITPQGALYTKYEELYENRNGKVAKIGAIDDGYPIMVKGNWAVYSQEMTLYLLNLSNGVSHKLGLHSFSALPYDLAEDGTVVYVSGTDYQVVKYKDGVTTMLTDPSEGQFHYRPLTDGTRTVYTEYSSSSGYSLIQDDGSARTSIAQGGSKYDYRFNKGWLAYGLYHSDGSTTLRLRSPEGDEKDITTGRLLSEALGDSGELIYYKTDEAKYYYAGNKLDPVPLEFSPSIPVHFRWSNGRFLVGTPQKLYDIENVTDHDRPETLYRVDSILSDDGKHTTGLLISLHPVYAEGETIIHYRINGGEWQTYSEPITVKADDTHKLEYYTTDGQGHSEKSINVMDFDTGVYDGAGIYQAPENP